MAVTVQLKLGDRLEGKYGETIYTATVVNGGGGALFLEVHGGDHDGEVYETPAMAAEAIRGKATGRFWSPVQSLSPGSRKVDVSAPDAPKKAARSNKVSDENSAPAVKELQRPRTMDPEAGQVYVSTFRGGNYTAEVFEADGKLKVRLSGAGDKDGEYGGLVAANKAIAGYAITATAFWKLQEVAQREAAEKAAKADAAAAARLEAKAQAEAAKAAKAAAKAAAAAQEGDPEDAAAADTDATDATDATADTGELATV